MTNTFGRREFLFLTAASAVGLRQAFGADTFVVADTNAGKVRGLDVDGIKIFKGIPYGANTTGRNRFMPPAPVEKWTGVRDALQYGPSAPQTEPGSRRNVSDIAVAGAGLPQESEDCLALNVWTPAGGGAPKRPLLGWGPR